MSEQRPNIILITTDQQRADCISVDEQAPDCLQTANLGALATAGARFRRSYSECPSCIPARRTLMSGMAPAAQGMVTYSESDWRPPHTLAGELRKAGYQTHLAGKLHLQPFGARFGFDSMDLSEGPLYPWMQDDYVRWLRDVHGRREYDACCSHGHDPNGWNAVPSYLPLEQTYTYWCVSKAIEFVQFHRDPTCPFFLNVSMFDPHPPVAPPQIYYDRYINRDLPQPVVGDWADRWDKPKKGLSTEAWRQRLDEHTMRCWRAGYYASINFVDDQVGRLLQFLRRAKRLLADSVVVFASDHGDMMGDHNLSRKCWAYEASARIPLLMMLPEWMKPKRGLVSDVPVGLQDIMPTLLDAAGVAVPESCTGRSLLPIVRGEQTSVRPALHGEHGGLYDYNDGMHYLVDDRYKYIWYSQRPQEHLFDLVNDPLELHDLSREKDGPARLAPWRQKLVEILRDRPEGFVRDGQLTLGAPHGRMIPDYQPDRFYPYL